MLSLLTQREKLCPGRSRHYSRQYKEMASELAQPSEMALEKEKELEC
jgi:hypothetical protein